VNIVFERTKGLVDRPMHYCSGCSHGIVHRLVAETLVELSILGKTVHVAPVGCAVLAYDYFNTDGVQAAHGRAPAVATGLKRANPDSIVFTYQGDGDLAAIGAAEMLHAAARGENITIIFVLPNYLLQIRQLPLRLPRIRPFFRRIPQAFCRLQKDAHPQPFALWIVPP